VVTKRIKGTSSKSFKNKIIISAHFSKANLTIFALIFAAIGGYLIYFSFAAGTTDTANLWVDSSGGSCVRSVTPAVYSDAQACGSFSDAYQAAQAGDLVLVKGGNYSNQAINNPTAKTGTNPVTFQAATGEMVSLSGLGVDGASYINLTGFTTTNWAVQNSQHLVLHKIKSGNVGLPGEAAVFIANTQDLKAYDSEVGPQNPRDGIQIWPSDKGQNKDILFDGLYEHDLDRSLDTGEHTDCVQLASGENVTFRRAIFYNCATQGFYPSGDFGGGVVQNVTLEDSWIGDAQLGFYGLQIAGPVNGMIVRNNTITGGVNLGASATDVHFIGNFFAQNWDFSYNCGQLAQGAAEFKYNLVSNSSCDGADPTNKKIAGARDFLVNPDATTASAYDLHLKSGAPAIDMSDFTIASGCSSVDFDNDARPVGALCDAGADEFGGVTNPSPTPPPPTPPSPTPVPTPPGCIQSTTAWQNTSFTPQTGTFTYDYDVVPAATGLDNIVGFSSGAATDYTSLGPIVRFNTTNTIDARNGSVYSAVNSVPYTAGTTYHIKLTTNVTNHTYSATVTPNGGSATTIATNYAFRTEQASIANLNNWALLQDPNDSAGAMTVCNATLNQTSTPKTGDINGDTFVNITDLSLLLSSYNQNVTKCTTNTTYTCDLSSPGDGVVNIFDLSILLSHYGA